MSLFVGLCNLYLCFQFVSVFVFEICSVEFLNQILHPPNSLHIKLLAWGRSRERVFVDKEMSLFVASQGVCMGWLKLAGGKILGENQFWQKKNLEWQSQGVVIIPTHDLNQAQGEIYANFNIALANHANINIALANEDSQD